MSKEKSGDYVISAVNTKNTGRELVESALKNREGEYLSYEDMQLVLKEMELVNDDLESSKLIANLRNGMSELNNEKDLLNFTIEEKVSGKKKSFRLVNKPLSERKAEVVEVIDKNDFSSMQNIARKLMRDRRMPFYGIYLPLRAVARWVRYSEENEEASEKKSKHEGDECERLLKEWFSNHKERGKVLSILGLGLGEGTGEIEILERLLKQGFKIHYCGIDMNPFLLVDHATRLKYKFSDYMKTGQLVCSVIADNFLKNLSSAIEKTRAKVKERKIIDDFIPKDSDILVTILGNVLGNLENRASEGLYFKNIQDEFEGQNIAFLLGVGVQQTTETGEPVVETYGLDDLFLATPRYLTHELGILKSKLTNKEAKNREFYIKSEDQNSKDQKIEDQKNKNQFLIERNFYQGDGLIFDENLHIRGDIYEFIYITENELTMDVEDGQHLILPPQTKLLLFNIIKFELKKLLGFIKFKGLKIPNEEKIKQTFNVGTDEEQRLYAVFAVIT